MHQHDDYTWEIKDARGIYIARVCQGCYSDKMKEINATYRNDVLVDSRYISDEAIEDPDSEWDTK